MFGMPDRSRTETETTAAGLLAGVVVSMIAARFVRAAWDASQREGERQRTASSR